MLPGDIKKQMVSLDKADIRDIGYALYFPRQKQDIGCIDYNDKFKVSKG